MRSNSILLLIKTLMCLLRIDTNMATVDSPVREQENFVTTHTPSMYLLLHTRDSTHIVQMLGRLRFDPHRADAGSNRRLTPFREGLVRLELRYHAGQRPFTDRVPAVERIWYIQDSLALSPSLSFNLSISLSLSLSLYPSRPLSISFSQAPRGATMPKAPRDNTLRYLQENAPP